ncbi:hypothetical protein Tco_1105782 [Tanacetum coccineum]
MDYVKKSIEKRALHKMEYDSRVNERLVQTTEEKVDSSKALDDSLVIIESNGTESQEQDTSSRSGNDAHVDDADIRPIYNEEPMAEVQTTAEINIFATGQQHTEQPEFNNEGDVDQNAKQCHDIRPLPAKLTNNITTELSDQSLESKNFAKPSILGKPVLQPHRNQFVVRQPTAFKSERPRISKPRFASQVDVNNNLLKPVTTHYLPKRRESAPAKPHHMIAPSLSRYSSNDIVHNHYLEEAKKKTHEHSRIPRNFSDSKHFVCSTCQKCVFNANHDACVIKFLKEVNSRAKVPSNKTTNRNKPVEQIRVATKPKRQIPKGHRFSIKKTTTVHEKTTSPRSCLRWQPTGRILKTVCLRWVPTGKTFASSTTKVESEPPNGSNADIPNQCESEQALNVSAGTLLSTAVQASVVNVKWCLLKITLQAPFLNVQMTFEHNTDQASVFMAMTSDHNRSELGFQDHNNEQSSSKLVPKSWAAVAILRTRVEVVQWIEGRSLEAEAKLRVVDANITEGSGKTSEIIRKLYEIEENRSLMREHFEEADILARTLRLEITKSKGRLNTKRTTSDEEGNAECDRKLYFVDLGAFKVHAKVMAAPTIPVSAEENLGDPIDIKVDIIRPEPVAAVAFPAAAEELMALRFRVDISEAKNALLHARIKTTEAIEKITRNRERQVCNKIEQQLVAVQESQRQDRENFRKL